MQIAALFIAALKHQTFLAKRLSSTLCVIARTQNVSFNPGQNCTFSTFLLLQMFFLTRPLFAPFHLLSHGRGGGASPSSNVLFKPKQHCTFSPLMPVFPLPQCSFLTRAELYLLTSACGRGGGGGGIFTDFPHGDYIMS